MGKLSTSVINSKKLNIIKQIIPAGKKMNKNLAEHVTKGISSNYSTNWETFSSWF